MKHRSATLPAQKILDHNAPMTGAASAPLPMLRAPNPARCPHLTKSGLSLHFQTSQTQLTLSLTAALAFHSCCRYLLITRSSGPEGWPPGEGQG